MRFKKTLLSFTILTPTFLFANSLMGSDKSTYTPDYLSIPKYEKCLGKEAVQDSILWCLPKEKPKSCPTKSWKKLQTVNLVPCMSDQDIYTAEQMPGIVIPQNGELNES
ncbi:hypothetical protein AB9G23_09595 [Francisella philomiragia]|uniref:hypothetical protein n=1 Tax=Francisella philomiragia TaxID=28110 RepID=UPI00190369F2|nr:hypothetical protein [Francisella philomiragia]MBK2026187.1 hypothetical protein [Francisella philomiragia]